jgi:hypothetical protein
MTRMHALLFAVVFTLLFSFTVAAQTTSREQLQKEIEAKRQELVALEQQFLSPSDADRSALEHFLSQSGTGLIRLLPREIYESEVYTKNKKTITMRGGGAYYSFKRLTHEYGFGSDIGLDSEQLYVGFAGADYGMLMKLDGIALEDASADHPAIRALLDYKAVKTEPEARVEQRRVSTGAEVSGFVYKNRLPLEVNTTYVLRSVNYDNSDILVVFRVVRKDTDGSAIIGWKVLKEFTVPKLNRQEAANIIQKN